MKTIDLVNSFRFVERSPFLSNLFVLYISEKPSKPLPREAYYYSPLARLTNAVMAVKRLYSNGPNLNTWMYEIGDLNHDAKIELVSYWVDRIKGAARRNLQNLSPNAVMALERLYPK